jgi:poly-gamma-glutamate synthesis protein (capsule biosynthesis protein)
MWKTKPDIDEANFPEPEIVQATPKPNRITIATVGDVGLGRETNYQILQRRNPFFPFEKIRSFLSTFDIVIGNLEGPVIENCPVVRTGFKFCGQPENVQGLTFAGFDALSLANNHINNYGLDGISQTTQALNDNNLDYFYQDKIWYKNIAGTQLAFLGFDDTVSRIINDNLQILIEEAKKNADIIIVNFHWGIEYQPQPSVRQKELAQLAINTGADAVIGHHPHVIQPLEYYQGKPIFYSLGNFVFDQMWSEETKTGAIGIINIENKKIVDTNLKKTYMTTCCQPELLK